MIKSFRTDRGVGLQYNGKREGYEAFLHNVLTISHLDRVGHDSYWEILNPEKYTDIPFIGDAIKDAINQMSFL